MSCPLSFAHANRPTTATDAVRQARGAAACGAPIRINLNGALAAHARLFVLSDTTDLKAHLLARFESGEAAWVRITLWNEWAGTGYAMSAAMLDRGAALLAQELAADPSRVTSDPESVLAAWWDACQRADNTALPSVTP